ncbi:hypothetical protein CYMTET_23104 [Cymbomonas tetramitiformis]|uniref:Sulfotransferase n=1 Tax=Cymbomonas tetramitiformis TaxID=36881 RepID=A0AAE0FYZ0_9CHLO|nr:hypothetical protein CYMTET_23104 [Cymbomonas tetramitiformis]
MDAERVWKPKILTPIFVRVLFAAFCIFVIGALLQPLFWKYDILTAPVTAQDHAQENAHDTSESVPVDEAHITNAHVGTDQMWTPEAAAEGMHEDLPEGDVPLTSVEVGTAQLLTPEAAAEGTREDLPENNVPLPSDDQSEGKGTDSSTIEEFHTTQAEGMGLVTQTTRTESLVPRLPSQARIRGPDKMLRTQFEAILPEAARDIPEEFTSEFKNPCWKADTRTHCLPYFFILGVFQCGVKDLYSRIAQHPAVVTGNTITSNFFFEKRPWKEFLASMDRVTPHIAEAPQERIAGDASAGTLTFTWTHAERLHEGFTGTMAACWQACQKETDLVLRKKCVRGDDPDSCYSKSRKNDEDNDREMGGTITLPYLVRAMYGEHTARFIAILRNPVDRLLSCYRFYPHYAKHYGASMEGFASWAREAIAAFQKCSSKYSERTCALYFESLEIEYEDVFYHADQLIKGMYSIFMEDWITAFPLQNFAVIRAEDYYERPRPALQRVFKLLNVSQPSEDEWNAMTEGPPTPKKEQDWMRGIPTDIPLDLRRELENFYAPFNTKLRDMLKETSIYTNGMDW